jgi:uncharacterized protein (DUF2062 family)
MTDRDLAAAAPRGSFWTRRVVAPIVRQLRQGVTPEQVALTIALGLVIGVFPIIGATTVLCGVAAATLGLNQPIIQMVNYFAYPAQLVALIPFYRAGESLFNRPHLSLSIAMLMERFRADNGKFFSDFGMIAVQGIVVWCLVAPFVAAAIYYLTRPSLRLLARRARGARAT